MTTLAVAHWGFWPIFPLFWAAFWIVIITLVVRARRNGRWSPPWQQQQAAPTTPTASAEQILAERYARGEMTDDEYFERISVLKGAS